MENNTTDKEFSERYGISEQEKVALIEKLSQDITWDDDLIIEHDELVDSEQDVSNEEEY